MITYDLIKNLPKLEVLTTFFLFFLIIYSFQMLNVRVLKELKVLKKIPLVLLLPYDLKKY